MKHRAKASLLLNPAKERLTSCVMDLKVAKQREKLSL